MDPLYTSSILESWGYETEFNDVDIEDFPWGDIPSFFERSSDIIYIHYRSVLLPAIVNIIEELKTFYPHKKVIVSGPGITIVGKDLLRIPHLSDIIICDSKRSVGCLVKRLVNGEPLKGLEGIIYKDADGIKFKEEINKDMNILPLPAYEKVNIKRYKNLSVITSLGCPFKCTFCKRRVYEGGIIFYRDLNKVLREIRTLHEIYGVQNINVRDAVFTIDRKRVLKFCQELKKNKVDIRWNCFGRIDMMDEELMKKMSESGCNQILYGVESGSNKVLNEISKGFGRDQARDIVMKSKKYFESVVATFIWGFPFETTKDVQKTSDLMYEFSENGIECYPRQLILYPGTEMFRKYRNYLEEGINLRHLRHMARPKLINLIKKYPDIFPDFYKIRVKDFDEKKHIIESAERGKWKGETKNKIPHFYSFSDRTQ